ncbi:MAG TPA: glycosyltransferase [Thermoanaerobaculia bacterium]|nr:glycosyltransferase [Thermoanaerobaculia bacterium]
MIAGFVLTLIALIIATIGTLLTSIQALLTRSFRRRPRPFGNGLREQAFRRDASFISILKPVCGLDDELEENLVSFTQLRGIEYEVILSAESHDDPALEVVDRVLRAHPDAPFRVVIDPGSRSGVVNRKVERLIAASRVARGDVLLISDSNVRVEPDDVRNTLTSFTSERIGCVSNLFTGAGARTLGATIESLHLLGFVVPGAVLASAARVPCVVGKSMAITRRALDAIGGFEAFRHVLAEDQAIGLAVKAAGFDVVLSPVVVRNVVVDRSVKRALDRQIRWNKIRYSFSHKLYAAEVLANPLPFALISPIAFAIVLVARCVQMAILNRATRAGLSWWQIARTPLLDLLMLYAWFVPFFSNTVTWRGYTAKIGRGTELIQIPIAEAA